VDEERGEEGHDPHGYESDMYDIGLDTKTALSRVIYYRQRFSSGGVGQKALSRNARLTRKIQRRVALCIESHFSLKYNVDEDTSKSLVLLQRFLHQVRDIRS